ncbi:hypothetical protein J41TS12_12810 [Paenibacillus antibioticophila]|uniref:Spore germination protein n=1 Tax=Paenibacillus antibioticophila TaxID=1274374 RepID=A0A919XT41_9BACL|nr:hypothetical protein [Paenibacillus antibioticophila]GIO36420.1 hypothetical protein J41TS12_12810 [Paenibacillus antibioticophila]
MASRRYYYYLFVVSAVINIINFVPRVLIFTRFEGVFWSILIAVAYGTLTMYIFTRLIIQFEGQGFPEIFNTYLPRAAAAPLLIFYSLFWFVGGGILLMSFVDITIRFISPDIRGRAVMTGFLLLVVGASRFKTTSILYATEIVLMLCMPAMVFILVKALINPAFNWDSVLQVFTYLWTKPKLITVTGASFVFTGYVNLAVFNRSFQNLTLKLRHFWLVPVSGLLVLLITLLVPIGYHGTVGVEDHVYSWFSTADSLRMETFVVERVLYLFYITYISMSIVTVVIYWHVGLELFKGCFNGKADKGEPEDEEKGTGKKKRKSQWIQGVILFTLSAIMIYLVEEFNQVQLAQTGQWFLNIRFFAEMLLILLLIILVWRKRRSARR